MKVYLTATIRDAGGQVVGIVTLAPKTFSTGSTGAFGSAKLDIGGAKYQAQIQIVKIGSKGEAAELATTGEESPA